MMDQFELAIEDWMVFLEANMGRSEETVIKYRHYLLRLREFLADKGMDHLTATQEGLDEFTGMHLMKRGLKSAGRKPVISAIKGFFKFLQRTNVRMDNPSLHVLTPKLPQHFPSIMQLSDAEKLLAQPDLTTFLGVRDAAIISIFIGCGFRMSGVKNLNESSLIFTQDEHRHEILIIRVEEKGKKVRMVPAPDEVRLMVRAYLGHPELQGIIRDLDDGDKVLFVSTLNRNIAPHLYYGERRRISNNAIDSMLKKYGKQAGIDHNVVHAHALRHLYGTELAEESVDLHTIMDLMGHADANTAKVYNHAAMRKLRRESAKGNPLSKITTPVTQLLKELNK